MKLEEVDPDAKRVFSILGIATALFGILLAAGFIVINGLAAASVLMVSGSIAGSWGGFSAETHLGRTSNRMGVVLFIVGLLVGFGTILILVAQSALPQRSN